MKITSQFSVAVHILVLLALENKTEPTTSEYMAGSVSTNPVVIRRVLGLLTKAGLVTTQSGTRGGACLARPAEKITLLDVYHALGQAEILVTGAAKRKTNPYCICARNIKPILDEVFDRAEKAVEQTFAEVTIAALTRKIVENEARPQRRRTG